MPHQAETPHVQEHTWLTLRPIHIHYTFIPHSCAGSSCSVVNIRLQQGNDELPLSITTHHTMSITAGHTIPHSPPWRNTSFCIHVQEVQTAQKHQYPTVNVLLALPPKPYLGQQRKHSGKTHTASVTRPIIIAPCFEATSKPAPLAARTIKAQHTTLVTLFLVRSTQYFPLHV